MLYYDLLREVGYYEQLPWNLPDHVLGGLIIYMYSYMYRAGKILLPQLVQLVGIQ